MGTFHDSLLAQLKELSAQVGRGKKWSGWSFRILAFAILLDSIEPSASKIEFHGVPKGQMSGVPPATDLPWLRVINHGSRPCHKNQRVDR